MKLKTNIKKIKLNNRVYIAVGGEEKRRTTMSNEANVVLQERCYAETIEEVENMTLKQLRSCIKIHPDTRQEIDGYIIAKATHKFNNLPDGTHVFKGDVGGDKDE